MQYGVPEGNTDDYDGYGALTDRITSVFCDCVMRMPGNMPVYQENRTMAIDLFTSGDEPVPLFVVSGSGRTGLPTSYGSDVDFVYRGTRFLPLIERLVAYTERTRCTLVWNGKNLLTMRNESISVDVLVEKDFSDVMPWTLPFDAPATTRNIVETFNGSIHDAAKTFIHYSHANAQAMHAIYDVGLASPLGRSIVVFVKMMDPRLPTCLAVILAALVETNVTRGMIPAPHLGFGMGLEIVAQFAHRFIYGYADESHIQWSFHSGMWVPFCDRFLRHMPKVVKTNPIAVIFKDSQLRRVQHSGLWGFLALSYPIIVPDGPPPMICQSRYLNSGVVRRMASFIVASSTRPESVLRSSSAWPDGYFNAAQEYCTSSNCKDAVLAGYMATPEDCLLKLTDGVAAALETVFHVNDK